MTATLHALGSGRGAGAYYTEDPNREARPRSRDNYYARDDGSGTWWSTASSLVRNGSPVDRETFWDLCAGIDPRTGKDLVRGSGERHRAGWDITFSTPKSFGILWAAGTAERRAALEKIQQDAVDQALQFVVDERLVEVRLGAGGHLREAPSDILVAKFPHFTSREGDPTCHTHCVLLNAARSSADRKKYRTLEPRQVYAWQVVLGASFRTALSQKLVEMGFSVRAAGRDQFEIAGIPDAMIERFSKRSKQIKARVREGASAAEKEVAALATRRDKASVPAGDELERRWQQEFAIFDIDPWGAALEAGRMPQPQRASALDHDLDPPEVPGDACVAVAASKIFRTENVLKRKALLHRALVEASLQGTDIKSVYAGIAEHETSGELVRLDRHEIAQHWTTAAIAADEAKLLRLVKERMAGSWFRPEAIEVALKDASSLSEEQRQAIRDVTSAEPTSVLEAGAGTGKTTLAKVVVEAAKKSGLSIVGLAPSWVAADELARSTGIETFAIARFRHELAVGRRRAPDANTLVIVDESGMVGTRDMAAIFDACTPATTSAIDGSQIRSTPKILLCGDRRQLASVTGGSALRAVSDLIERRSTLTGVRRQTIDWQRAASVAMAQGDSEAGMRAYAEHGRIEMVARCEDAQARTIKAWQDLRQTHGDDVIIVTRRNRDAVSLNLAAREVLREDGLIQGKDVNLTAIDRDSGLMQLPIARGDRIRFGETLHQHGIRNGTRGNVVRYTQGVDGSVHLAIRLDDGRLIEDAWSGFSHKGRHHHAGIPRIVHAVAGSAYSVQGRTAQATVHHIAISTDARETYVALTRHRHDVRIVVESERLDAGCRARQEDPRMPPTKLALQEWLFGEASRYNEKANVVDHVADRVRFIETGLVELTDVRKRIGINIGAMVKVAQRIEVAARSIGSEGSRFIAELSRRAMSRVPDTRMLKSVKMIVQTIESWDTSSTRLRHKPARAEYDR
ncbi:MobF family relaxase [Tardiphaga sp.]|uniref:MobF family relaxase n=1 Tax=Tardiphaga sp. TaxID=1926292 RepID=UPI002611BFFB|nr:MobF family relaxase [Tardiphaga sp.]MDB5620375.1 recD [Tardiphaga sp.]